MSRRRWIEVIVCSVFLFLIVSTVNSLFSDVENAEAEATSSIEPYESRTRTSYTSASSHTRGRHAEPPDHAIASADSADAGVDEVFVRELTLCIAIDCWARRGAGDGGVAYALPPPPPKVR
jgi:hypothetical protein